MEACGGLHYWARRFREHGHEVRLLAPQFVTPYRKRIQVICAMLKPLPKR
jgi:transposase